MGTDWAHRRGFGAGIHRGEVHFLESFCHFRLLGIVGQSDLVTAAGFSIPYNEYSSGKAGRLEQASHDSPEGGL